jgi:CheY-like chemotaxis protein
LCSEGYTLTVADRVPTDLTEIDRMQPDVIVLDDLFHEQPHGGQLIQALKQRPTTRQLPILVWSGARRTVQAQRA